MAYIKYRPESVEFYAPDSFERLGEMSYCTVDNAAAAKNYVRASNCDSCDSCFTIADYEDRLVNVGVSGVDTVKDRIGELEEKIKKLELTIATRDYGVMDLDSVRARRETRMDKLRRELKTLRIAF